MTKSEWEDLIDTSVSNDNLYENIIKRYAVIKRGVSPHPYADEWHRAIEGEQAVVLVEQRVGFDDSQMVWKPLTINTNKIKIMPKEPVYEWKYLYEAVIS